MFACLLPFLFDARRLEFGAHPLSQEMAAGRAVYRAGAGIERTLMADRSVLGTWFDGRVRRVVDSATWLSPELLARCLGYIAERDALPDEAMAKRWAEARTQLDGRVTFIVRLAAFPRLDPFEFGSGAPPKSETLKGVKFRLSIPTTAIRAEAGYVLSDGNLVASANNVPAVTIEKENPADVLGGPFFSLTPYSSLFLSEGEIDPPDDGIPLGDYYGAVYVVSFPLCQAMHSAKKFELDVQLPTKREVAQFALDAPSPEPRPKNRDDD